MKMPWYAGCRKQWTIEDMFEHSIRRGECLIFQGSTRGQIGYAQFPKAVGRSVGAPNGERAGHVVVWMWKTGKKRVPLGRDVMHSCDTPLCIEPRHVKLGTRQQNLRQMWRRGRGVSGYKNTRSYKRWLRQQTSIK